jgi:hypothetical protein
VLVARQVLGELSHLLRQHPEQREDDAKGAGHDDEHAEHPWNLELAEEDEGRGKHEAQQDGDDER